MALVPFICRTCGVQYAPSESPPEHCPICEDERQYVGWNGQQWTTLAELAAEGRHNTFEELEPGLFQIATRPPIAIGQRALVCQTPAGNVMWDCISLVDDESIEALRARGGLRAIAISSPERLPGPYAATATWREQSWNGRDVDCTVGSWRGLSGPPRLDCEQIAFWRTVLGSAVRTAQWRSDVGRHFWTEMYLDGKELRDYLERERVEMLSVLAELGLLVSNAG